MKLKHLTTVTISFIGLLGIAVISNAAPGNMRGMMRGPIGNHEGIILVLEEAGCPLTEDQLEQIQSMERGPETRGQFQDFLTDEQKEALQVARPNREGMQGRMRIGNHVGITSILEEAGCPLTEDQLEQIQSMERGPETRGQFQDFLTDEQKEALQAVRTNREGMQGRMRIGNHVGITSILEEAGCPLTEDQIEQLQSMERGPEAFEQRHSVLTDEQKEALQAVCPNREGLQGRIRIGNRVGITSILEEAGCPLTEDQIEQLRSMKRGPEAFEQRHSVLTDEQKEALQAAFKVVSGATDSEDVSETVGKYTTVEETPETFNILRQNYPNPFNPSTTIEYQLAEAGQVKIEVYGPSGQHVATMVNQYQNAGTHSVTWNASSLAGGIYLCKIISGDYTETVKMTYVK